MSSLRRQGTWAVVDQVLSSGTNFVPAILVARVLGPSDYGAFAIVFVAWFGALSIIRAALMGPYTLAAAYLETDEWRAVTKRAAGAVMIAGALVAVGFAIAGLLVGTSTPLGQSLIVIGVLAPALCLQEFWRVASFAASRAKTATANDAYWAIGQFIAFGILLLSTNEVTAPQCVLAWGAGAVFAAGIGIWQLSVKPSLNRTAVRWAREWSALGAWFTADAAIYSVGAFGSAIIVAAKIGTAGLGLIRVVQNLFGPIQLITMGGGSAFLPYLVRVTKTTGASGIRPSWRFSFLMTASITVYGVALLAIAKPVLTKAFGLDYRAASALVLPVLVAYALDAVSSGAQMLLRARALMKRVIFSQSVNTAARFIAVFWLAAVGGLRGAAWGAAIGSAVGAVIYWVQVATIGEGEVAEGDVSTPRAATT